MSAIDRFIRLSRDLRRDQRGIAVPTALMAMVASFALASVAVMSTVDVQQGTHRDHDSKEAIAAADAGANIAMLRLNRFLPYLSTTHPCIGPNGEYQTPTGGWCPSTATEQVGGATYSYMVSSYPANGEISVVSVGNSGTVSRRVSVSMKTQSGKNVFANERVIGQEEIEIIGNPRIETDIGTNGSIDAEGSYVICGNDRHGAGHEAPTPSCGKEKSEGNKELPAITPPANLSTENDNCRVPETCTGSKTGKVDPYSKKLTSKNPWEEPRHINIASQQTLTMGGTNYFVCELNIQGKLYMPVGAHVTIYIDTPEHCGLSSGAPQLTMGGNAVIESSAYNPAQGLYEVPSIYLLGNGEVKLDGTPGTTDEVMIYAPYSHIDLGGNATWNGMLAGKSMKIHGNPVIKSDPNLKQPELTLASLFQRTRYVECTGATGSPPNANC
ncbi:MAG TPA: hypothetical protein VFS64_08520 [Solirubrobacterales bacterium]|nr:hypothetical protein [Solirubrobacterales bacterium]